MRKLTFPGFLKRYMVELSNEETLSIYRLARESVYENPRLREPLFLYALSTGNVGTLLKASRGTELVAAYRELLAYDYNEVVQMLEEKSDQLGEAYHKVWRSFCSVREKPVRDDRVKELLRLKIKKMQMEKNISTYRICKDLNLGVANVNCWLKNGTPGKVRLDTAKIMLQYLE